MRTIDRSNRFKRDYRRELKGSHGAELNDRLMPLVDALASDTPLEPRFRDHGLTGEMVGYRDCHVWPDLLLIYTKPDTRTLRLVRLGSHTEVFR